MPTASEAVKEASKFRIDKKKKDPGKGVYYKAGPERDAAVKKEHDSEKYSGFREKHNAGRDSLSVGIKKTDNYSAGSAPRVGGVAVTSSTSNLKGANKKQMKAGRKMSGGKRNKLPRIKGG